MEKYIRRSLWIWGRKRCLSELNMRSFVSQDYFLFPKPVLIKTSTLHYQLS